MRYLLFILLFISFASYGQNTPFGATASTGIGITKGKVKVTYYGASDTVILAVRPSDSMIIALPKNYYATRHVVDSLIALGAPTWGNITGTLSSQTDLQTALDTKAPSSGSANYVNNTTTQTTGNYNLTGSGKLGAVPLDTAVELTNTGDSRAVVTGAYVTDDMTHPRQLARMTGWELRPKAVSGGALSYVTFTNASGLTRLRTGDVPRQDTSHKVQKIMVSYGTNDLIVNGITAAAFGDSLEVYADSLDAKGYRPENVLFCAIGYIRVYNDYGGGASDLTKHMAFNAKIASVAAAHGYNYYDSYADEYKNLVRDSLMMPDGLHEVFDGHCLLALGELSAFNAEVRDSAAFKFAVNGLSAFHSIKLTHPVTVSSNNTTAIMYQGGLLGACSDCFIPNNKNDTAFAGRIKIRGTGMFGKSLRTWDSLFAVRMYLQYGGYGSHFVATNAYSSLPSSGKFIMMSLNAGETEGLIWARTAAGSLLRTNFKMSGGYFGDVDNSSYDWWFYGTAGVATTLGVGTSTTSPIYYGGSSSGGNMTLSSTSNGTKGSILFGSQSAFNESNTRLGIGTSSPSATIDATVNGNMLIGNVDITAGGGVINSNPILTVNKSTTVPTWFNSSYSANRVVDIYGTTGCYMNMSYTNDANNGNFIYMFRGRGSDASPTAITSGSFIGGLDFFGYDGTQQREGAFLAITAAENWGASNRGSAWQFKYTRTAAAAASVTWMTKKGTGAILLNENDRSATVPGVGIALGSGVDPSALLHIAAGAAAAGNAPLKINAGTNLTTPENGAMENDGTHVYFTLGGTRYQLDQQTSSGTYTPTLSNTTNVAASTAYVTGYCRVGNTVTVYGKVDIDATLAASVATELGISLPVASNFTGEEDLGGTATGDAIASLSARIKADATNDRASVVFKAISLSNDSYNFQFSYQVK